ncbi:MAG: phosphoribosylglycinamide formyltransferase [Acidimicrobiales bacterium]
MASAEPGRAEPRLVVMVSGSGTNLQAILDAVHAGAKASPGDEEAVLHAKVALVISNNPDAYGIERAKAAGVATSILPHQGRDRFEYDTELAYEATIAGADLVVLAGWNRVLTDNFLAHHTVINLHPAKPGAFPGLGAIGKAYEAWQRGEVSSGGVMVHYVPDEGVDDGPVIDWVEVPFVEGDTLETFEQRVHHAEHRLLVKSITIALNEQRAKL